MAFRCRALSVCLLVAVLALTSGYLGGGHALGAPGFHTIPDGRSTHVIWPGYLPRTFRVYRPPGLTGAVPLVVMLHGGFGDSRQAERAYNWDAEADYGRFIVAYPEGLARSWNSGGCCGPPARADADDIKYIASVVHTIELKTPIDTARVYATGMSNGAMMALRLACQTDVFAAIAPVAGTLLTDCSRAPPTSVLQIHGTADESVPYNGGPGKARSLNGTPRVNGPSVPEVNAMWRSIDSCAAPTSSTVGAVTTETAACPDGRTVQLIAIAGAGHQWPGSTSNAFLERLGIIDPPSTALNATDTIWQFFALHHL